MGSLFLFYFILQRDLGRVFKVKCYDNFFKTQKFYFRLVCFRFFQYLYVLRRILYENFLKNFMVS